MSVAWAQPATITVQTPMDPLFVAVQKATNCKTMDTPAKVKLFNTVPFLNYLFCFVLF